MYRRYLQLFNMSQILVNKTYFCCSNRRKNSPVLIKINISLLYTCNLVQYIEETSERTERHRQDAGRQADTDITSSIQYVNGGTLLLSASSNKQICKSSIFFLSVGCMFYTLFSVSNYVNILP